MGPPILVGGDTLGDGTGVSDGLSDLYHVRDKCETQREVTHRLFPSLRVHRPPDVSRTPPVTTTETS